MVALIRQLNTMRSYSLHSAQYQAKTLTAGRHHLSTSSEQPSDSKLEQEAKKTLKQEKRAHEMMNHLYDEIKAQRFKDIVVIQTKFNADPRYLILASAFNSRHLVRGTEMVNKQYKSTIKKDDQEFAKISISSEWNVIDFKSVVVHLFSPACRDHFDIEQLWAVGPELDHKCNFPDESESNPSTDKILADNNPSS